MIRSRRATMWAVLLAGALAGAAGCRRQAPPVAELTVSPSSLQLAYAEFTDIELAFTPKVGRAALGLSPTVFVHLLDGPGNVLRTFDHPLPASWKPGQPVRYPLRLVQSALGEPLPEGGYTLSLGIYDADDRRRFPLEARGEEIDRAEYAVAAVRVPPPTGSLPRFEFSSSWLPAQAGADQQLVASRWLGEAEGSLRVTGLAPGSRLHLVLRLPSGSEPGMHFERLPDVEGPVLQVRSNCSPEESMLTGPGAHTVELTVPASSGEGACDLHLAANFLLAGERAAVRFSVRLESLAWQSAR
jgi:hypothetical protein